MRLWERASGALKDRSSIWQANLTRPTPLRNPDIEKALIRATTHDPSSLHPDHLDHLCQCLRQSPANLKPLLWSFSNRLERTRSWVVALKGLYLMHIVINSRVPCVRTIGRLPFDLSTFSDGHLRRSHAWPFDAFVRAYYKFLDRKSTIVFQHADRQEPSMMKELLLLQKLQGLVDLLIQIKPMARAVYVPLILHVMDGIIIEIYDVYSRICRGIAVVIMNIYSAGKAEATMALEIVQKASEQGEELLHYFEFCQEIGVVNASEFPVVDRVPDEGIHELEKIIKSFNSEVNEKQEVEKAFVVREVVVDDDMKKMMKNGSDHEGKKNVYRGDRFRTIITDNWEKFDQDFAGKNPFGSPEIFNNHAQGNYKYDQELPDLMTF